MLETNPSESGSTVAPALDRAIEHHRNGELTKAEWAYQEVLEQVPDHPDALHLLGVLFHQLGDSDSAIERVLASLDSNPEQPRALNNLGNIYASAKRREEAIDTYQKAIELNPEYTEAIHNLGNVFNDLDRLAESIECYRRAIELVQDDATTWSALGAAYEKLSQFDAAIDAYQMARALDADAIGPVSRLGAVYRKQERFDAARDIYQQWLDLRPEDPIATHFLHACDSSSDQPERASADYVRSTFDGFAEEFDECLRDLNYQVPTLLGEMAAHHCPTDRSVADRWIVDLGCGTGLCGPSLRPLSGKLVGVDLSPNMLFYAKQRETYDELVESDLVAFLESTTNDFDLMLSADTLVYLGDLRPTFSAAAKKLRPGGAFIFSLEELPEEETDEPYRLRQSGRFAHRESIIRRWLTDAGFSALEIKKTTLRNEGLSVIQGFVIAAQQHAPSIIPDR